MFYKKLQDKELLASYTTAMNYSGKPDKDLLSEINNRGGIEKLKEIANLQQIKPDEQKRIANFVIECFNHRMTAADSKQLIESDILSNEEKSQLIDDCFLRLDAHTKDRSINMRTIIGSIVGFIISVTIGAAISYYTAISSGKIYYAIPVIIFIISYVIIRVLIGQSKNNWLVFVSSIFSAICSFIIGLWIVSTVIN